MTQDDSFDTKISLRKHHMLVFRLYKKIEGQRLTYKTRLLEYACGKFKKTSKMDSANTSFWISTMSFINS